MSKRFELINFLNAHDNFKDNKNNKKLDSFDVVVLLNHYDELQTLLVEKDQRIAELEEQLKNKPKYDVGDRVYVINEDYEVERDFVESIDIDTDGIEYYTEMYSICWYENQLFKTKEEAQAKLEELGEKR